MQSNSLSLKQAIVQGLVVSGIDVNISDHAVFIPKEDKGNDFGLSYIGNGTIIRAGAIICTGVNIGDRCLIGHNSIIRHSVRIGNDCTISHLVCIENKTNIGNRVRISTSTHITSNVVIEDEVQLGAHVVTINDDFRGAQWFDKPPLYSQIFRTGCRVGSGCTVLAGVEIGQKAVVGAGSVITRSVPGLTMSFGNPAYVQREII